MRWRGLRDSVSTLPLFFPCDDVMVRSRVLGQSLFSKDVGIGAGEFGLFDSKLLFSAVPAPILFYPCFATRLGGVSGGKESQGWCDSSQTATVGAGKFGSAKLPTAMATYPGKPSLSQ